MSLKRFFLFLMIGSVAISALVGIVVILFGNFGSFEVRALMTTLTISGASILGLACGAYLETGRGRALPMFGIGLSIVSAILLFFIIWDAMDDSTIFIKTALTATLLAFSCSHLSILSLARLDNRFDWTRKAAFAMVWLLAAILLYILWMEPDSSGDLVYRVIGVLSILIAAVTVLTPILHKISRGEDEAGNIDAEIERLRSQIRDLEKRREGLKKAVSGDPE